MPMVLISSNSSLLGRKDNGIYISFPLMTINISAAPLLQSQVSAHQDTIGTESPEDGIGGPSAGAQRLRVREFLHKRGAFDLSDLPDAEPAVGGHAAHELSVGGPGQAGDTGCVVHPTAGHGGFAGLGVVQTHLAAAAVCRGENLTVRREGQGRNGGGGLAEYVELRQGLLVGEGVDVDLLVGTANSDVSAVGRNGQGNGCVARGSSGGDLSVLDDEDVGASDDELELRVSGSKGESLRLCL